MPIFDLHCDVLWNIFKDFNKGEKSSILKNSYHIDLEKLKKGNVGLQGMAIFNIPQDTQPFTSANTMIDILESQIAGREDIKIVYSYEDIVSNLEKGVITAMITMEDAFFLEGKISNLEHFYRRGLRMIALNHNVVNGVGNPNYGKRLENGSPDWITRNTTTGLTEFGFEVVDKMNELGMIIDLSHMSDKGFYDAIKASKKPVITSHSNADSVCKSLRNLTDDMLYKLADNGGLTGLCFAPGFLAKTEEDKKDLIPCILRHADHVKNLIGIDHIAFGSDFDGVDLPFDCSIYPTIIKEFEKHGYTTTEIEKITHLNALRVFKDNLK